MKNIMVITLFLTILTFAIVGCLAIFEVMPMQEAKSLLIKVGAAILLLGGCTALVALLTGSKNKTE